MTAQAGRTLGVIPCARLGYPSPVVRVHLLGYAVPANTELHEQTANTVTLWRIVTPNSTFGAIESTTYACQYHYRVGNTARWRLFVAPRC